MSAEQAENNDIDDEKTSKLIHFHDVTNIEDLDRCKEILERYNWDIEKAVQSTFGDVAADNIEQPNEVRQMPMPPSPQQRHPLHNRPSPVRRPIINSSHLNNFHSMQPRQMIYIANRRNHNPQSILEWAFFIFISPFHYVSTTLFDIMKFFWRAFFPDPREQVVDPLGDVKSFIAEFNQKYNNSSLNFIEGTYKTAQQQAKQQLKFLLLYLHDSNGRDTDPFCHGTLCNPETIEYINSNFLLWGCSIQKPEGYRVSKVLRNPTYPCLALICMHQGRLTVVARIHGQLSAQELVSRLREVSSMYEPSLIAARADREALDMNKRIREEQDQAYEKALEIDRQKKEEKRVEEEIKRKELDEIAKAQEDRRQKKENHRLRKELCKSELPVEPCSGDADVVTLQIKLSSGARLRRCFKTTDSVKVLHDFVYAEQSSPYKLRVISCFPRRPIANCSTDEIDSCPEVTELPSLKDVGLDKNETLSVENACTEEEDLYSSQDEGDGDEST